MLTNLKEERINWKIKNYLLINVKYLDKKIYFLILFYGKYFKYIEFMIIYM